jgi:hypothetical protein
VQEEALEEGAEEVPEEGVAAAGLENRRKDVHTMIRRTAIACVALVALMGASDALAKKKKPKIPVGPYVGATSDGIPLTVTLDPGRATGSIAYCGLTATFSTGGGTRTKSFTVVYQDPTSAETINGAGVFSSKKRSVSGTLAPNGCDSAEQSYSLHR